MQLKTSLLLLLAVVGVAVAQRGSYGLRGSSQPLTGTRYQEENSANPAQSNFVAPASSNQGAPSSPTQGVSGSRINSNSIPNSQGHNHQHQPGGFGSGHGHHHGHHPGAGFPNQGFQPIQPFGY